MPELNRLHRTYKGQGLVLIAVHCDPNWKQALTVAKDKKAVYAIAQDKGDATGSAYKITGYPTTFVIDRKGIIRAVDPMNLEKAVKAELSKR